MAVTAYTVHLVRHGEVHNPDGLLYGRLPGYHLSDRGRRQAQQAAAHLAGAPVAVLRCSPLERTRETAEVIGAGLGLEPEIDERLLETATHFEGLVRGARALLSSPRRLWHLRNPLRPSWGEAFSDIEKRMLAAIEAAVADAGGRDVVIVTHQTPLLVARAGLTGTRLPPWLGLVPCSTGSVTSITIAGGDVRTAYYEPPG